MLVFSKSAGYPHASIPDGILAIQSLGAANGFVVDASDDASVFNDATLASYQPIIFLNTTGDILNAAQPSALQHYIRAGGGFVGVFIPPVTRNIAGRGMAAWSAPFPKPSRRSECEP